MNHLCRWLKAREAERRFWSQKDVRAIKTTSDWQTFLRENFNLDFNFFKRKKVLEIGCGPYGIIHFIDPNLSVGVDPLFFSTWNKENEKSCAHIVAVGEFLPLRDSMFDVCISFNVLDHTIIPKKVMGEMVRVLKVMVNCFYGLILFVNH